MKTTSRVHSLAVGAVMVALAGSVLVGCGNGDEANQTSTAQGLSVSAAWARTSPMSVSVGAVYMTISSDTSDELVSAWVDASIAARAEIHETVSVGLPGEPGADASMSGDSTSDATMSSDSTGGMSDQMTMQPIESLAIPAGGTVELSPGGYHIMLFDLAAPLEVGQKFDITLTFATAGTVVVSVEVRDDAP